MSTVVNYFKDLKVDTYDLVHNYDIKPEKETEQRIGSLFLRVIGGLLLCLAANAMLTSGVTVPLVFSLLLARDCIIVGNNMMKELKPGLKNSFALAGNIGKEMMDGVPYQLQGTLIFKQFYLEAIALKA